MITIIPFINIILAQRKRLLAAPLLMLFCSYTIAAQNKTYSVGIVPQFETHKLYNIWQPILDRLHAQTGLNFKLLGSPSIPAFEKGIISGKFDFAYMNPYQLLQSQQTSAYQPLIKDLERRLYGVLVVRKDSEIKRVEQLDKKTIAFPSANAMGASLLLRAEIAQKFNINIIPRYVKTHNSVYLNVFLKQTAAGGGVQKTLHQQKDSLQKSLRILFETQKVTPHPFAAHKGIPKQIQQRVAKAFINMNENLYDRNLISKIPIIKAGYASLEDYAALRKLHLERFYLEN